MSQNNRGQQATTKTPFQRMVARIAAALEKDNEPKHPGVIMNYQPKEYDYGGYSDPMTDDQTPDFIRRDNEGWQVLK